MKYLFGFVLCALCVFGQSRPPYYQPTDNILNPTNLNGFFNSLRVPLASALLRTSPTGLVSEVTIGANLQFDGTTLSALAGATNDTIYISNIFVTNLTVLELTVISNSYESNVFLTEVFVTNNISVKGNANVNNLIVTNNIYTSFIAFTNLAGIIDTALNEVVLSQARSLKLQYPRRIDGAGCTYGNTNDFTADLFMVPGFSGTAATNGNWAVFKTQVPGDIDTTRDLTVRLKVQTGGTSTDAMTFTLGMASIADGSSANGTAANYNAITVTPSAALSGGAATGTATLTGWAGNVTAGQLWFIQLQRAGAVDTNDDAAYVIECEIFYTSTQ